MAAIFESICFVVHSLVNTTCHVRIRWIVCNPVKVMGLFWSDNSIYQRNCFPLCVILPWVIAKLKKLGKIAMSFFVWVVEFIAQVINFFLEFWGFLQNVKAFRDQVYTSPLSFTHSENRNARKKWAHMKNSTHWMLGLSAAQSEIRGYSR